MKATSRRRPRESVSSSRAVASNNQPQANQDSANRSLHLSVYLIVALYFMTRVGNLFRDLVFEEPWYLVPGRFLFEGRGFYFDWGVFQPHANSFGHPPLAAVLNGLFSFVGNDPVVGARLVPFLVGLFACLLPLIVTRSVVPSLLVLMSPFLYGVSGHIQTDPTTGLLGYALICWSVARFVDDNGFATRAVFALGIVILWTTKLETAVIATTWLAIYVFFQDSGERIRRLKVFALGSVAGLVALVLLTLALGSTTGLGAGSTIGEEFGFVSRFTASVLERHARTPGTGFHDRAAFFRYAMDFKIPHLFLLCLIPCLAIMIMHRWLWSRKSPHVFLLLAALLPVLVYLAVGLVGDGFPRYFVIAFPPLLILLGLCLGQLTPNWRRAVSALVVGAGAVMMLPQTWATIKSPGSATVARGERGAREAALFVANLTRPGDLVMGPDNAAFYVPDRVWMVDSSFVPYPASYPKALALAPRLKAVIAKPQDSHHGISAQLIAAVEDRGARRFAIGSYLVVVGAPEGRPRIDCGVVPRPRIFAATLLRKGASGPFEFTIEGQCWDADSAQVEFTGPYCDFGCLVPSGAVLFRNRVRLEGLADLLPRAYSVRVSGKEWSEPFPVVAVTAPPGG